MTTGQLVSVGSGGKGSKMAVATDRKEKPLEMKQKKVQGVRTSGKTTLLAGPVPIGQTQGERAYKQKAQQKAALSPERWGALLLVSLRLSSTLHA